MRRRSAAFAFAGAALAVAVGWAIPALAAAHDPAAPSEAVFFAEVLVLVVAGRLGGEAMQRIGQPAVMGQLLAGVLLGPSFFGVIWPAGHDVLFPASAGQKGMLNAVAQLGVLMLLLLTGMETDLRLVRRVGRPAVTASLAGIAVPFGLGVFVGMTAPADILPDPDMRLATALFLGTALSIASVKIVALVVRDLGFLRRNIGQTILASAILDDTIAWILIGVITGLTTSGTIDLGAVVSTLALTGLFVILSLTLGRRIVSLLIRWTNDSFISEMPVISVILAITLGMAMITDGIGVHTVLGAFAAGVLIGESPILTEHIQEEVRGLITALFMPVFFCLAGLSADLRVLADPVLLGLTVGLIVIASLGKFGGAFVGGWFGGLGTRECLALAAGMNARGSTEVIVATIGLSIGALDEQLYTMIVTMAVVTTLAMPPMLRWALLRVPFSDEEKERLEREEFEEKGFVTNLERLLLAVDGSANGRLAAQLAGLISGARGLPTTVLNWQQPEAAAPEEPAAGDVVKASAETARSKETFVRPGKVDVTTRAAESTVEEEVVVEKAKGYDILFVGLEGVGADDRPKSSDVARAAEAFAGPVAVAHARGLPEGDTTGAALRILVPVNGSNASRRAAEVAFALARSSGGRVTALYVPAQRRSRGRQFARSFTRIIRSEEAILRDIAQAGQKAGAVVRTAVRSDLPPDLAIIAYANRGRHDVIVLGVNRQPGDRLSFGVVADTVLERSQRSVLIVAT